MHQSTGFQSPPWHWCVLYKKKGKLYSEHRGGHADSLDGIAVFVYIARLCWCGQGANGPSACTQQQLLLVQGHLLAWGQLWWGSAGCSLLDQVKVLRKSGMFSLPQRYASMCFANSAMSSLSYLWCNSKTKISAACHLCRTDCIFFFTLKWLIHKLTLGDLPK